jgi:hypothetical protein
MSPPDIALHKRRALWTNCSPHERSSVPQGLPGHPSAPEASVRSSREAGRLPGIRRCPVRCGEEVSCLKTNLVKRGKTYVFRKVVDGRLVRISLGTDYQAAVNRLRSLTDQPHPARLSVEEAAKRWLEVVPLSRRDASLPSQRVRDYLIPFMGHFLLSKVSGEAVDRTGSGSRSRARHRKLSSISSPICVASSTGASKLDSWNAACFRSGSCRELRSEPRTD